MESLPSCALEDAIQLLNHGCCCLIFEENMHTRKNIAGVRSFLGLHYMWFALCCILYCIRDFCISLLLEMLVGVSESARICERHVDALVFCFSESCPGYPAVLCCSAQIS